MDIRNFFGKKSSGGSAKKVVEKKSTSTKQNSKTLTVDDDSDATTDGEPTKAKKTPNSKKRVDVDASAFFANGSSGKKPAAAKRKAAAAAAVAKKAKETVSIVDDDSDTDMEDAPAAKKTAAKKSEVVNLSDDTDDEAAAAVARNVKPKRAANKKKQQQAVVNLSDSDGDENVVPAPTKRKKASKKKTKKVVESSSEDEQDVVNLSDSDDDDVPVPKRKKATAKKKEKSIDSSDSDTNDKPPRKRRAAPAKKKKPACKDGSDEDVPTKKRKTAASRKRRPVESEDDDDDDADFDLNEINKSDDDDDDDDIGDDEDDFVEKAPAKTKAKAKGPPKKSAPVKKKAPIKKSATVKKDPLIEPSLKVDSFDIDKAVPECLAGLTFVFSGVLDNLGRTESIDYVKILGGRVTTAVSSKTSYLVVGELLEDGRNYTEGSKYRKASEIKVRVVKGAEHFYGLCKLYNDKAKSQLGDEAPSNTSLSEPEKPKEDQAVASKAVPSNPYAKKTGGAVKNPYATAKKNPYAKAKPAATTSNPYARTSEPAAPTAASTDPNALWADKYAPASTREILGNQDSVKKLQTWLNRWEHTFNNEKAHGKAFSSPAGPWRAALLSGPPGIGKTTTATLVAKEAGRDVMEMNASDARSKKALTVGLGDVTGSQVINFGVVSGGNTKQPALQRRCLIMDEVDGMGAGDRSGMAELIKLIKNTRVPIICICNDRQSQKMRSLVPYCMDLRYKRPVKSVIARRAVRVGEQEGMRIEQNAAEAIAESCGNDIRQVLNCLQMWASSKEGGKSVTYKDMKKRESAINKDEILRVSMFDATKMIIEGRKGLAGADAKTVKNSLYRRSDAYFVDYSLMGLNVHQNYLKVMTRGYQEAVRDKDDKKMEDFTDRMHSATMAMSDYAVGEQAVRGGDQNWSLLPFIAMMAVKTGYHGGGENGGFLGGFPEFAGWMGKNSSRGKKIRLLNELGYHMNYKVSTDKADLRLHYLPLLRERFMELLANGDKAKVNEAIELMDQYGLDRDDLFENMDEFKIDSKAKAFSDLDSKQKAAFTREYNKGIHKSQALVHEQGAAKVSKKPKGSTEKDPADMDAVDDDGMNESEDDDEEEMTEEKLKQIFGKKAGAKKGKGAAGAKKTTGKRKSK